MAERRWKTSGANHSVMRELNRSLVLDLVKRTSPTSRTAIAKATGLAKPTVSGIVDDLVAEGLLREIGRGETTSEGGRPPRLLEFSARSSFVVGVHLGVRTTKVIVADAGGGEIARLESPTVHGKPSATLAAVADLVNEAYASTKAPRKRFSALGLAVPGSVNPREGLCMIAPNLGWRDVECGPILDEALKVRVFVHNAAQAALVAETVEGAARGATEAVLLYAGTGIGSAILTDGRLHHGFAGISGEIGHCLIPGSDERCGCGKHGCLEAVASGPAVSRAAGRAIAAGKKTSLRGSRPSPEGVEDAAALGDKVALRVLTDAGKALGMAASWLINLMNPQVVVLAGGLMDAGEALRGPIQETALAMALPQAAARVKIARSELGGDAEARGAVLLALQESETYYRVMFQA